MTDPYLRCQQYLDRLERRLQSEGLWSNEIPEPASFDSTMPFCVDTMTLPEWLQFVFLPRMQELIERRLPLPSRAGLHQYAEVYFQQQPGSYPALIRLLAEIDAFIAEPTMH
ncbi:YqcC family protein [Permianibacter aggregans]|uniref:dTDP-4-dehydrorhamnose 3,5-epimerase n=1 Tax=Permianibacter aggregans TaxID=1510150 RepID=A0A4R6UTD5_9GAMM|nr:YqcC family protein [Permianibacter aggregans]QGX38784.1 YqcC family protein [Permianibacter aggregans]TDQ50588.1 dTDP-4-dehydrorhamnose 3,5-epimerase [Permianibacter aggregans]